MAIKLPIKCSDTKEICSSYKEYLASEHWKGVKEKVCVHNSKCPCCRRYMIKGHIIAHHKTYKRIGHERIKWWGKDVIGVCDDCHDGRSATHKKLHKKVFVPTFARVGSEEVYMPHKGWKIFMLGVGLVLAAGTIFFYGKVKGWW